MTPQPREGSAEEGASPTGVSSHAVDVPENLDPGHQILRQFSHRCRNSLSGIRLGLYLLKREAEGQAPACWDELARTYEEIEQLFDTLQRIYQSEPLTLVRSPLGQLISERLPLWQSRYSKNGRAIEIDPPADDVPGDFDPMRFGLGLDAFVAWRSESRDSIQPRLAWRVAGDRFEVCWQEAPRPTQLGDEFQGGFGQSQPPGCSQSLALLLLARVAATHDGSLEARNDPALEITLRWPRFRGNA
jgi:hypothetical protein